MDNQQPNFTNQFIIDKYNEGLSSVHISNIIRKHPTTILRILRRNNISIRTIKESVVTHNKKEIIELSSSFKNIMLGLLAGDGSLRIPKKGINPKYTHTDKNHGAIIHFRQLFIDEGIAVSDIYKRVQKSKYGDINITYKFETEVSPEFLEFYSMFYPIDTRKRLPNFRVSPLSLLYWYIGDGSVRRPNNCVNFGGQITNKWGNENILNQMKDLFGDKIVYYDNPNYRNFYFPPKEFKLLLSYIGECPIECYKYKWISRRGSTTIIEPS